MTPFAHRPEQLLRWFRLLAWALAAAIGLAVPGPAATQEAEPADRRDAATDSSGAKCWTPATGTGYDAAGGGYLLGAGDRLKISIYQRPDLSGEFQVRDDGTIAVPLLGPIMADGVTVATVETTINAAMATTTGRTSSTGVEIVLRRPFIVAGHVAQPGPHPFVPGTTAMRAIAMGGGLYRAPPSAGFSIEASRESAKLAQVTAQMTQNLIRRARLVAERDEGGAFEIPGQLRGLDPERVEGLAESERRLMEQRLAAHLGERKARQDTIELAKAEIAALEGQHESITSQIELAQEESAHFQDLMKRGLGRRMDVFGLQRVTANLQADEREVFARIQNAKVRLVNAQRELRLLDVNRGLQLEEEIGTVEKQIAADEMSAHYSRQFIADLTGLPPADLLTNENTPLNLEIIRQADGRQTVVEATEITLLCPGDVLMVSRQPGAPAAVNGKEASAVRPVRETRAGHHAR